MSFGAFFAPNALFLPEVSTTPPWLPGFDVLSLHPDKALG
jgi:hypothetical protein